MNLIVKNAKIIDLPQIVDGRDGVLSVAEESINIPFLIKRVFYIYNLQDKNAIRGKHAHRNIEQVLFCINGSFEIILDDGKIKQKIKLDKPNKGVFIGSYVWNTMTNFSDNCIILVFASDFYKEDEYIRNYDVFLNEI